MYANLLSEKTKRCIFAILTTIIPISANLICSVEPAVRVPKYHLMEKCHRSKLGIAAKANYTSLTSCQRFGIEKKALALNFSPPEAALEGEPLSYTCEVLKCAETDGGLSLMNDSRYDYYSIYARPLPSLNSTCVQGIGMFRLLPDKCNFSEAIAKCRNLSGVLADVTSEQHTDALAQMLAGVSVDAALVGMKRTNSSNYYGLNGASLSCSTYRAWAPGHPRRYPNKFDCMVLTRHRTWQSVPCRKPFLALCELIPGGPYKKKSIFASRDMPKNDYGE